MFSLFSVFKKIKSFFFLSPKDLVLLLCISSLLCFLDLLTKHIVFNFKEGYIILTHFLNIFKVNNFGVSFGLFSENPNISFYFIIIFDLCVAIYLVHLIQKQNIYTRPLLFKVSISMIIGGAFGNMIDRIIIGSVRDFIDFHYKNYHWPCFNVADICVCLGVFIWIMCEIFFKKNKEENITNSVNKTTKAI